eukprot:scaffold114420_cov67-Cyclotella_meneghiniana.AAC.1
MKLTIASASIAFLCPPAISASIVAANINKHENNKGSIRPSATKKKESTSIAALRAPAISASIVDVNLLEHENNKGFVHPSATKNKECAFVNGVEVSVAKSEDVGILSCEIGELCAEDTTSSLGGRCVSVASNPDALGTQRELADPCDKCKGGDDYYGSYVAACDGVSDSDKSNNIACGSCNGPNACANSTAVTIGANSCVGSHACLGAQGEMNIPISGRTHVWEVEPVFMQTPISGRARVRDGKPVFLHAAISGRTHVWEVEPVFGQTAISGRTHVWEMQPVFMQTPISGRARVRDGKPVFLHAVIILNLYVLTNPNLAVFNSATGIQRAFLSLAMMYQMIRVNVAAVVSSSLNSAQRVNSVNIISINGVLVTGGFSHRRLIGRNLSEATVEYEILLEEICSNDGCSDAATAAQALYEQATDAMREAIDSGAFATAVRSDAVSANVDALLEIAVASSDFSSVVLNLVGLIFSEQPSELPSGMPTESPSSEPSGTPSCTPSSAPTPSPSINLFYPDQSESGKCLNDGGQPAWMEANPSAWLSTTLEKCCTQHASWNLPDCVGSHPRECATTL